MKPYIAVALALGALPLAASADYVERYWTRDGRMVERRVVEEPRYERPYPERYYSERPYDRYDRYERYDAIPPAGQVHLRDFGNGIHAGANNPADRALAERIASAFAADSRLEGITATVVANRGRVSLQGSSPSIEKSQRAERIAQSIAGVDSVTGTLDQQGGN